MHELLTVMKIKIGSCGCGISYRFEIVGEHFYAAVPHREKETALESHHRSLCSCTQYIPQWDTLPAADIVAPLLMALVMTLQSANMANASSPC